MLRLVAEKTRAKKKKDSLTFHFLYSAIRTKGKHFWLPNSRASLLYPKLCFFNVGVLFFFFPCFLSNQIINGLFGDSIWVTLFEFFWYACGWKCVLCCLKCVFCFWVVLPNMPQISKNGKVMTFYFIWMLFLMFDFKWSLGLVIELNLELVWAMKSKMSIVEH